MNRLLNRFLLFIRVKINVCLARVWSQLHKRNNSILPDCSPWPRYSGPSAGKAGCAWGTARRSFWAGSWSPPATLSETPPRSCCRSAINDTAGAACNSIPDKKIGPKRNAFPERVARAALVGFGFAFVTCRDRFTVKHSHQMSRFRDVCTLGTHDDIMHYVRTLNIYELFNDTVRPASINYAFFHPVPARTHAHIAESLSNSCRLQLDHEFSWRYHCQIVTDAMSLKSYFIFHNVTYYRLQVYYDGFFVEIK